MVQKLGLKVSKCPSIIKAVNSEAKLIFGIAYGVNFKVDKWTRKVNFLIMQLDDFNVILGDEFFFVASKAALLPFIGGQWVGKTARANGQQQAVLTHTGGTST